MHRVPIVDIAFSLELLPLLEDDRKIARYLTRARDTFEMTNQALLKQAYDQQALIIILNVLKRNGYASLQFKERMALMIQNIVQEKNWQSIEDSRELANLISCLRDIDASKFRPLLEKLLDDFGASLQRRNCTSNSLVRIYLSYICLFGKSKHQNYSAILTCSFFTAMKRKVELEGSEHG